MKETKLAFGQRITKLREEQNLSIEDLAKKSSLPKSLILDLEENKTFLNQKTLLKLIEALNCSENQIIDDKDWLAMLGNQIGDRIRSLRDEKGLSLTELGNYTDLSPTYLSEIEREESIPALHTLRRLADFFRVPVSIFLSNNSCSSIVADKLIKARKQKGVSQKELADLAGVSPGLIGQLEKGKVNASLKTVRKLSDVLGVTVCYLILEREEVDEIAGALSPNMRDCLFNPDVQLLVAHICKMSKEDLNLVFNFVNMLKEPKVK